MADTLCTQCGLCCDGTFYGSVAIVAPEVSRLERVGLRVVQEGGTVSMPQPCVALRGCLCSVYVDRPGACAKYECELRKKVSSGACRVEEALETVTRMHALLAVVRDAFECPPTTSIWEKILTLEEAPTAAGQALARERYAGAIDAVEKLLALGRAEFEPRFGGGGGR